MKKIAIILAIVIVAALATAGFVYAQASRPGSPTPGPGWMWNMHNQMMGSAYGGMPAMHDAMVQALASKLGLPVEALNQRLSSGESMWQVAETQGWTREQFQTWMVETHKSTIARLVADGTLTQQQADWMNSRMSQMIENGYGPGSCPGFDADGSPSGAAGWMGNMMRGRGGGMMGGWSRPGSDDQ